MSGLRQFQWFGPGGLWAGLNEEAPVRHHVAYRGSIRGR